MIQRRTTLKGALAGAFAIAGAALAQGSNRNVKIIHGFLAGGLTDVVSRHVAEGLNRLNLGYNFLVDSRPGASGRIAATFVKQSAPDGLTLLFTGSNLLTLTPHLYKNIDFNPFEDFVPVHTACTFGYGLSVGPAAPSEIKTLKDYLAWVKANPAKGNFAGVPGAPQHLLAAYMSKITDTPLTLVPYKGGGPAMAMDIIRGEAPAVIQVTADTLQFRGPDKLRPLASFTKTRSPFLPDLPTASEAGVPGLEIDEWMGVFAPKGTPSDILNRWATGIAQVVATPAFKTAMATQAAAPFLAGPQQLARLLKEDYEFWAKVVSTTGFRIE